MRKSKHVQLSLLVVAAGAVAACSSRECLDANGARVDAAACAADAGTWRTNRFFWWGTGYHSYYRGSRSGGGTGSGSVSPPSPASRGGFGATGESHEASS